MLARNVQREIERDLNLQSKAAMVNSDAGTSSDNGGGRQYQVFLNFHGPDTRYGFTDFLYQDLVDNCIHVFMDDELPVGEEIGRELLQAIDNSQIYIPIFSRNYASSKWCLRELARMVDNTSKSEEKKILPIFYDVEPKDVDLKTPLYRKAIGELKKEQQEKFPHEVESWEGESWEEALQKVDKIKGWELPKCKSKAELKKMAAKEVLRRLKRKHKFVTQKLVGLDGRAAELRKLLAVDRISDVRLLGLHGMGGVGKTTLAKFIYNELSSHFGEYSAFLDDIREKSKGEGLFGLQKKLLAEIACSSSAETIKDVDDGRDRIEQILARKKVLIVLDDIDETEQIENLVGSRLHRGTRIIITTRNTSVLEIIKQRILACEVKKMNSDCALQVLAYEMNEMNFDHALQLFKSHAFLEGSLAKDFYSLSRDIVSTTGGLPLALELIGSLLCGKSKARWEIILKKLKKIPLENVRKKLMISYEALDDLQREIFLDVACFLIDADITNANYMWEACEFHPEIEVLVEMSLIKIKDNKFWMHDQLRDLGRYIVRQESPKDIGKRSRLWTSEEVLDFVRTDERRENVEALDLQGRDSHILIKKEEIERFENLRFLRLSKGAFLGDFMVCPPKLKWISWCSPPPDFSTASVHLKNLLILELFDNHFADDSKVWESLKMAAKLKSLALVKCHGLTRTPNLSGCLTLEILTFDHCLSLEEIDSSIGKLTHLLDLNITFCNRLKHVPEEIRGLVKLERFSLKGCCSVRRLPTSISNIESLRKLDLSITGITSLPDFIITGIRDEYEGLVELRSLSLSHTEIKQIPDSIGKLKSLRTLDLSWLQETEQPFNRWELPKAIGMLDKLELFFLCNRYELVGEIPDEIGRLSSLRVLDLRRTNICRVPEKINKLSRLLTLDLTECNKITELPKLPASLIHLRVTSRSLQEVPNLSNLTNLVELVLSDGFDKERKSNLKHTCDLRWIGRLSKLQKLELCLLNIAMPPTELGLLSLLEDLTLVGLDLQPLKQLPPSLLSLVLDNFGLIRLPQSNLEIPSNLTLRSSQLQEVQLHGFLQLQHLRLVNCHLQSLSIPSSLRTLIVFDCPNMIEIQVLDLSASLEELKILMCESIGRIVLGGEGGSLGVPDLLESSSSVSTDCSSRVLLLPNSLKLKKLELHGCFDLLEIQVIGTLLSLQSIFITFCNAMENLTGISNLKNLHDLGIDGCSKLRVVEGLDELEFLTQLNVCMCPSLETLLDISNSKIPDECLIQVSFCSKLLNLEGCTFERYKRMAQQGAPQSETNKEEAKMEGDAMEPDIELQPQFHPSASSWDHEFSEEPGTPPEKQNQMTEKDSKPSSLDEVAPPRAFCDTFMTCLASILECVCNHDSPSIKS